MVKGGGLVFRGGVPVLAALVMALLASPPALGHAPGITERVSVGSTGAEANNESGPGCAEISAEGRFVVFSSRATNLIPDDTNGLFRDAFVHDRLTGETDIVSVSSTGAQGDRDACGADISDDGRFVIFSSLSSKFVAGDTNGLDDVFRHDRSTGETVLVSVTSEGKVADNSSFPGAISADGRLVTFDSNAALVPEDTNGTNDVYVRDLVAGVTELISVSTAGAAGNGSSFIELISADGRFVAFRSSADDLIPNDTDGHTSNIFVRDRMLGTTEVVSVDNARNQAESSGFGMSADGRFVAFTTGASLVPEDTFPGGDVYLRDRGAGTTELVSVTDDEAASNGSSFSPAVSAHGRFVAFESFATNLTAGESPPFDQFNEDVFVRDREAGTTSRISETTAGQKAVGASFLEGINGDGLVVAFSSADGSLVPDDTNGFRDTFVHDERPPADLAVAKSESPDPALIGRPLVYTVVVTNNGPSATAAGLVDTLSGRIRFLSVTTTAGTCTRAGSTIACDLRTLDPGAAATVTIEVRPIALGTITNTVRVGGLQPDPDRTNNTDVEMTTVVSH